MWMVQYIVQIYWQSKMYSNFCQWLYFYHCKVHLTTFVHHCWSNTLVDVDKSIIIVWVNAAVCYAHKFLLKTVRNKRMDYAIICPSPLIFKFAFAAFNSLLFIQIIKLVVLSWTISVSNSYCSAADVIIVGGVVCA